MVETENIYDFESLYNNLKNYYNNNDFSSNDGDNKMCSILFKFNNIIAIYKNVDNQYVNNTKFNQLSSFVQRFIDYGIGEFNNLNSAIDNILNDSFKYLDFNVILGKRQEIRTNISLYKAAITKQKNLLNNNIDEIDAYVKETRDEIENEKSELNSNITSLSEDLENIKSSITNINETVDNLVTDEKNKFEKNNLLHTELFEEKMAEIDKESEDKFNDISSEYREKFDVLLEEIKQKDEKISELIGMVGEKSKIGEYKENADNAHKERMFWQALTVMLFAISLFLTVYFTITIDNYTKMTFFKYSIALIILGVSTYTGKQAGNSRRDEVYYRKQQLELASIDIYLESMKVENREEIKKQLATKMFGQAYKTYSNKYDDSKINIDKAIKLLKEPQNKN